MSKATPGLSHMYVSRDAELKKQFDAMFHHPDILPDDTNKKTLLLIGKKIVS